ncbi:hypothetical protein N431DRAFT_105536 [Stipitochalara longipes BDJ]|nr:hypothetical protein N431DRAFT_105536 [Stipitochalara longipes BDJ]
MFRDLPLWLCLLSLLGQGDAALVTSRPTATPTIKARIGRNIDAIVPTTTGQIGINPVESDLGDPSTYLGIIYGTDTQYITVDSYTTKWIGVNTEYLSIDGTSTVDVVFATATAEANGQNIGDISIILPEGLAGTLTNSVSTAIDSCGAVVTKRMRREIESRENLRRTADAVLSCFFQYAKIDAEEGGTFDLYIEASKWVDAGLTVAENAPAVLVNYLASISKEEAAKTLVWLALCSIALDVVENAVLDGNSQALSPVGKVNIPAAGFATQPPDEQCDGSEEVTEDSLLCLDYECQGEALGL